MHSVFSYFITGFKTGQFATRDQLRSNTERVHAEMAKLGISLSEDHTGQHAQNAATIASEKQLNHGISTPESNAGSYENEISAPDDNGQYMTVVMPNPVGLAEGVPQRVGASLRMSADSGGSNIGYSGVGNSVSDSDVRTSNKERSSGVSNEIPRENKTIGTLNPNYLDKAYESNDGQSTTYHSWEQTKQLHYRSVTRFVAENKPKRSPNVRNWLDSGGKIEVREVDGVQIWKYVHADGDYAYCYKDNGIGKIVFPEKYVYQDLPTISIGKFSADREVDRKLTIHKLKYTHGMDRIPDGYAHHHTYIDGEIQFIKKEIHKKFSHIGGHSVFKNRRN